MKNSLSFSTSPLTRIINAEYYDLESTLGVMEKLWEFSIIQGYEFQHLAEWDRDTPPRDSDPRYNRFGAWKDSIKYTIEEIAEKLNNIPVSILSVHGNRDIGILACSNKSEDIKNAKKLIIQAINLAKMVSAKICVFHLWDTHDEKFDPLKLKNTIDKIAINFPKVQISVENILTNLKNYTPFELIKIFNWITLDLRWAGLYDELNKFSTVKNKIVNIHVRGQLEGNEWKLKNAPFTLYGALDIIINQWKYKGILTFEPEGGLGGTLWENLVGAIDLIKKRF